MPASPSKRPSANQIEQIRVAIAKGDFQGAIDATVEFWGIDTTNVSGRIKYDPTFRVARAVTDDHREIAVGPQAMRGASPESVAATVLHEVTHANQFARRLRSSYNQEDAAALEYMAYAAVLAADLWLQLDPATKAWHEQHAQLHWSRLTPGSKEVYNQGLYFSPRGIDLRNQSNLLLRAAAERLRGW